MLARKRVLGDYQVGKTIGQGAFSKVKIGVHKETNQKVAIKIIDKRQVAAKAEKAKKVQEDRDKKKDEARRRGAPDPKASPNSADQDQGRKSDTKTVDAPQPTGDIAEAIKLPSPNGSPGAPVPTFVSQLQLEVQLLMRLDHPNVIRLYQVMETEEECFVVMEYAQGGELIEHIAARGYLPEKEARRYFRQIISAMDHCHLANVVHRDLKLENLLLNGERDILISDFGLGRTYRSDSEELMKTFCGTPNYAAVELISGIPYVGVKSDIWAMGVVLYVMMTGRPPFSGENISALYNKIKAVDYKCPEYFSRGLRQVLAKILVKDPKVRISMAELREDPWVNFEEIERPIQIIPKVMGSWDASQIGQFITGITYDQTFVIYTFRRHLRDGNTVSGVNAATVTHNSPAQKREIQSVKRRKSLTVAAASTPSKGSPRGSANLLAPMSEDGDGDQVAPLPPASPLFKPQPAPVAARGRRMSLDSASPSKPFAMPGKPSPLSAIPAVAPAPVDTNRRRSVSATPEQTPGNPKQQPRQRSVGPSSRESSIMRRMSMVSPTSGLGTPNSGNRRMSNALDDPDSMMVPDTDAVSPNLFPDDYDDEEDDATAVQPSQKEIESWHMIHRPAKVIRTVRFAFHSSNTSTLSPSNIFQEVHRVLVDIARSHDDRLVYKRVQDFYMFNCKLTQPNAEDNVEFEIEVCKVWLLKLHGVRVKRLSGNPFLFKELYSDIVNSLEL
ncbi:Map microtubule affinity-regulating kinase [Geranomyces michiganensis]|nr:Map microtubule affinity-regulating kinase [Geranomyces michiganensis]